MIATLLGWTKLPQWALELIVIGVLVAGFGATPCTSGIIGAAHEIAALKASSDKLLASTQKQIAQLTTQHAADTAKILGKLHDEQNRNAMLADSDASRLREFDAYRRAHPALGSTAGKPGTVASGTASAPDVGELSQRLEQVAGELANATRVSRQHLKCLHGRSRFCNGEMTWPNQALAKISF